MTDWIMNIAKNKMYFHLISTHRGDLKMLLYEKNYWVKKLENTPLFNFKDFQKLNDRKLIAKKVNKKIGFPRFFFFLFFQNFTWVW